MHIYLYLNILYLFAPKIEKNEYCGCIQTSVKLYNFDFLEHLITWSTV